MLGVMPLPRLQVESHSSLVAAVSGALVWLIVVWFVLQQGFTPAVTGSELAAVSVLLILLGALPTVGGFWIAAAGLGYLVGQRGVLQFAAGSALLLLINYLAAWAGLLQGWLGWAAVIGGAVTLNVQVLRWRLGHGQLRLSTPDASPRVAAGLTPTLPAGWWVGLMPGLALLAVAACVPAGLLWRVEAFGYDATSYHLQIPKEWAAAGVMRELEHNVYAYLPGLVEAAYARLMTMRGGDPVGAVYTCQLFHASFVVLAAGALAGVLRRWIDARAAAVAGSLLAVVPWTLVTGSLAYNEQVVIALAAAGLLVIARTADSEDTDEFDKSTSPGVPARHRRSPLTDAAVLGLLCGGATLAKLTAGFTVALPLGLLWLVTLLGRDGARSIRRVWAPALLCAAVGCLVLSPYLTRNALWTGNPVFPFAADLLGLAHWTPQQVERWHAAHFAKDAAAPSTLNTLWRQAIGNVGYGALGGQPTPRESHNIARFATEGGLPLLWLLAAAGAAAGLVQRSTRPLTAGLLAFGAWQLGWWLLGSHQQSRFLILIILPLAGLTGVLLHTLMRLSPSRERLILATSGGALLTTLTLASAAVLWTQTAAVSLDDGRVVPAPLFLLVDGLPEPAGNGAMGQPPLHNLPEISRTLVVGNNQGLFYIPRPMVYSSAFDTSPLAAFLAEPVDAAALARRLREAGFTHVYLGYSELDRLHATYGYDPRITAARLKTLTKGWSGLTPPDVPTALLRVPNAD